MARTTSALVGGIIEWESDSTKSTYISLTPFIEGANLLITSECSDSGYDATKLELIERWLSAHFYTIRDMRAETEKAGSVSQKLQSKVDLGFDTSHYGQMAMRLDTAGNLASLNERIKRGGRVGVGVTWLGTEDPTDWDD